MKKIKKIMTAIALSTLATTTLASTDVTQGSTDVTEGSTSFRINIGETVSTKGQVGSIPDLNNAFVISTINTPESGITSFGNYFSNSTYKYDSPGGAFDGSGSYYDQPKTPVKRGIWISDYRHKNIYLGVYFNEIKKISGVSIFTPNTSRGPKDFRIEYTKDHGANWIVDQRITDQPKQTQHLIPLTKIVEANGFRIFVEEGHVNSTYNAILQFDEMEVLDTPTE